VYAKSGSAPIGITETTMMPTPYCYANNEHPHLTLWDMPGVGAQRHPGETYFEDKALYAFDCLLLLKSGRFTEVDIHIYKLAVMKYKIPIAVVMTRADRDVNNEVQLKKRELGRKLTSYEYEILIVDTVQRLKNNAIYELVQAGCPESSFEAMFVVAPYSYRDQKLGIWEETDCPGLETEQLLLACSNLAIYRRSQSQ
jgi:hypothetical protein